MIDTSLGTAFTGERGRLRLRATAAGIARLVEVSAACCRIGSAPGCTLRLRAPRVKDVHCLIYRGPSASYVRDLAGDTLLNGDAFHEAPLAPGDVLQVGSVKVAVVADQRPDASNTPVPESDDLPRKVADLVAAQTAELRIDSEVLGRVSSQTAQAEAQLQSLAADVKLLTGVPQRLEALAQGHQTRFLDINNRFESLAARLAKAETIAESFKERPLAAEGAVDQLRTDSLARFDRLETSLADWGRTQESHHHQAKNERETLERTLKDSLNRSQRGLEAGLNELKQHQTAALAEVQTRLKEVDSRSQTLADQVSKAAAAAEKQKDSLPVVEAAFAEWRSESLGRFERLEAGLAEQSQDRNSQRAQSENDRKALERTVAASLDRSQQKLDAGLRELKQHRTAELTDLQTQLNEIESRWRCLTDRIANVQRLIENRDEPRPAAEAALAEWRAEFLARFERLEASLADSDRSSQREPMENDRQALEEMRMELRDQAQRLDARFDELGQQQDVMRLQWQAWQEERHKTDDRLRLQMEKAIAEVRHLTDKQAEAEGRAEELHAALANVLTAEELEKRLAQWLATHSEAVGVGRGQNNDDADDESAASRTQQSPREAEELTFEAVSDKAPLSSVEVLRRLGQPVPFDEEEEEEAQTYRPEREPTMSASANKDEEDENDNSVEEYMARLLGRPAVQRPVEGNAARKSDRHPVAHAAPVPKVAPPKPAPEEPYRPRTAAPPELSSHLSAMRDLANNAARRAIDRHRHTLQAAAIRWRLLFAVVGLVTSLAFVWQSNAGPTALCALVASGIVVAYLGTRSIMLTRRLHGKRHPDEDHKPAASAPTATRPQEGKVADPVKG